MNKKQITITLTDLTSESQNLQIENEGFEPFELMGVLVHFLETTKNKLDDSYRHSRLEKEMD